MGREFEQGLDTERFRQAFRTLGASRTAWPAPRDFIEALPARQQLALAKTPIPANPERVAEAIAQAKELLGIHDGKKAAAGPDA